MTLTLIETPGPCEHDWEILMALFSVSGNGAMRMRCNKCGAEQNASFSPDGNGE